MLSLESLFWGSSILAVTLNNWVALALFPAGILFLYVMGRRASLNPTDKKKVWSARRKALLQFSAFLVVLFSWVYFSGGM
jgi:hypothetical protein